MSWYATIQFNNNKYIFLTHFIYNYNMCVFFVLYYLGARYVIALGQNLSN